MPVIKVDSFSGGRNVRDHQLLIQPNQCASASRNVWAPEGYLTKGPGWTEWGSYTATGGPIHYLKTLYGVNTSTGAADFTVYAVINTGNVSSVAYWFGVNGSNSTALGYRTGTVKVTGVSATGVGTLWNKQILGGVRDILAVTSSAASWKTISSVEDNTHLTLTEALPADVGTAESYTILHRLNSNFALTRMSMASLGGKVVLSHFSDSTSAGSTVSTGLLFYDGATTRRVYTSTAVADGIDPPRLGFLATHQNYLFGARTSDNPSRLFWSDLKNPYIWPTNNFIDIAKDDSKITGLFSYGNELIVFKENRMFKIVGETFDPSNPTFGVQPISVPVDFKFNHQESIVFYKGALVFVGYNGMYSYSQGTNYITKISYLFDLDITQNSSNPNIIETAEQSRGAFVFRDFLFYKNVEETFSGTTGQAREFGVIDPNGAAWMMNYTNSNTRNASGGIDQRKPWAITTDVPPFLLSQVVARSTGEAAKIMQLDVVGPDYTTQMLNSADGAMAIDSVWVSKEFNIGYGWFERLVLYLEKQTAGNLTVEYSIDQGSFTSKTVDMSVGRGTLIRSVIDINQRGSTIQLRLSNSTVSQTFRIFGFEIEYETEEKNRRR